MKQINTYKMLSWLLLIFVVAHGYKTQAQTCTEGGEYFSSFPATVNGITVSASYSGGNSGYINTTGQIVTCGIGSYPSQVLWTGNTHLTTTTIVFTFSQPVNNIEILAMFYGSNGFPLLTETSTFQTDGGTPSLSIAPKFCTNGTVSGNTYTNNFSGQNAALIISAPSAFTQVTITHPNTAINGGVGFSMCGASVPLPVTLLYFNASKAQNGVLLHWATASEQNNKGFEVEKSANGSNWSNIGFVSSKAESGNSSVKSDYNFTDNNPANGKNFYRLRQVDFDGKYEYSPVRMVSFDEGNSISIYPNPVKDNFIISGLEGNESIVLYDAMGRKVRAAKATSSTETIQVNGLSKGVYHLQITGQSGSATVNKIVVE